MLNTTSGFLAFSNGCMGKRYRAPALGLRSAARLSKATAGESGWSRKPGKGIDFQIHACRSRLSGIVKVES